MLNLFLDPISSKLDAFLLPTILSCFNPKLKLQGVNRFPVVILVQPVVSIKPINIGILSPQE